jgi:hypothetical protein
MSAESYVGQAVLVLDFVRMEYWSVGALRVLRIAPRMRGVGNVFRARLSSSPDPGLRSLTRRGGYTQFFPTEDLISPEILQHLLY